jgi:hypothetical protein
MIQANLSKDSISPSTTNQHIPRRKPSRPLLPSAVLSDGDRGTWWSAREDQRRRESVYSSSSRGQHHQGHTQSTATWQPAWNEEYEEALQSETGSIYTARDTRYHHHRHNESITNSDQSHMTSTHLLHRYQASEKNDKEEDLKEMWEVASSLLTRPASILSYTVDMSNAGHFHEAQIGQPERRQRILFPWSRMGKPAAVTSTPFPPVHNVQSQQVIDPESIAEGIVECTDVGRRASTATALTWRTLLPSPRLMQRDSDALPKSSSAEKSFSDSKQVKEPTSRCRWWVIVLCLFILAVGITCIVFGILLSQNGGDWGRLLGLDKR